MFRGIPILAVLFSSGLVFVVGSQEIRGIGDRPGETRLREDPCLKLKCSSGKECVYREDQAKCVCVLECAPNVDVRRQVCSSLNETWESDCHFFVRKCQCKEGLTDGCREAERSMQVEYYGKCQQLAPCPDEVLTDLPRRMREWLSEVMKTKMDRPEDEARDNETVSKWIDAVLWKFCDLDQSPKDRAVSTDELLPLRAPFLSMEPCIGSFLSQTCDADRDREITLLEWAACLQVDPEEMEDRCEKFVRLALPEASD